MSHVQTKSRIIIVGGGTAGWMTAAALIKLLPNRHFDIKLIESEQIGTVGVGEATVPHIRFFNARLGIDEAEFMAKTKATFKLGIEFCDWSRLGDRYIHPFGAFGESPEFSSQGDLADFHHYWLRSQQAGDTHSLQQYSLPVQAARQNKFMLPSSDPNSALSTYSYAYQFDAGLYAKFLREFSEQAGVTRVEGLISNVKQDEENGLITAVQLQNGEQHDGDFFIDCSGFRALLIEQTLKTGYEDWTHWLPCDRALAAPCAASEELSPYTRATAQQAGWTWRIPLQHRTGNGHVYSSQFSSDEAALQILLKAMDAEPEMEPKPIRFTTGKRRKQWSRNVVAIGLSSGFLEPLESTSIHLIQLAIGYLVDLLPSEGTNPACENEFNRVMNLEYERIRDFLILHYHATERDDQEFWRYCKNMQIPESLAYRMELFKSQGKIVQNKEGMFLDASWLAVYQGQNITPETYSPMAGKIPEEELLSMMSSIRHRYQQHTGTMKSHTQVLHDIGAMKTKGPTV